MIGLKKNIIFMLIYQMVNYLVPLALTPYLVRVLGPSSYGELNYSISIVLYICLFVDFGFTLSATKRITKYIGNSDKISKLFYTVTLAKTFLLITGITILILSISTLDTINSVKTIIVISAIQIIATVISPLWLFNGLQLTAVFAVFNIIFKVASVPLVFFLVKTPTDVGYAAFFQTAPLFFSSILALIYLYKKKILINTNYIPRFKLIIRTLNSSLFYYIGTMSVSLYTMSTPIILGLVSTSEQVGFYSASDKIRAAVVGVYVVIGNVIYPRVQRFYHEDHNLGFQYVKKIIIAVIPLCTIASIMLFYISPFITKYFLGEEFGESEVILKIMSPMMFLIPLSIILSNYILLGMGHKKLFSRIPMITATIHIIVATILSLKFGSIGASIAILISEIVSFILLFITCCKLGYIKKLCVLKL